MNYEPGLAKLFTGYSDPRRTYHNWAHIGAMLDLCDSIHDQLNHPRAVYLAVLFHDAVYEPGSRNNELLSAALMRECIKDESLDDIIIADLLIQSTANHYVRQEYSRSVASDNELFLDMDLHILGADRLAYDAYSRAIREEFHHVGEDTYRRGRIRVLEGFLRRDRIFFSEWGISRWESNARQNIQRELRVISA